MPDADITLLHFADKGLLRSPELGLMPELSLFLFPEKTGRSRQKGGPSAPDTQPSQQRPGNPYPASVLP